MRRAKKTDPIEDALRGIEFPGEDEVFIRGYLEERGFVERVMGAVAHTHVRVARPLIWGAFAVLNVAIIVVAWTNPYLVQDVLALRNELFTFFFALLGLTLVGCLLGVILSSDLSHVETFFKTLLRGRMKNLFRHPRGP